MRARRGRALPLPAATGRSRPPSGPPPSSAPGPAVRQRSEAAAAPAGSPPRRAATLIPAAAGPAPPRPARPAVGGPALTSRAGSGAAGSAFLHLPPPAARPVPSRPAAPRCGRLSRDAGTGSSEGPRRRRCSARRREARPGAAGRGGSRASLLRSRGLPRRDGPQPLRAFLLVLGGNSTASGGLSQQTLLGAGRNR